MNDDSSNLDLLIKQLDKLLLEGYNIHRDLFADYPEKQKEPNFDLKTYTSNNIGGYADWYDTTIAILGKLPRSHYTIHFLKPKIPPSIHISGFPEELSRTKLHFDYSLYSLEEIILRLEENQNLAIRKEIAEKEYQADTIYRITYSDHTREVKLNNIVLTKTDFDSENDNCFSFIYSNPNRPIGIEELESGIKAKLKKRLAHIVRDLGFVNELKDVFFPVVTKNKLMFINPITKQYIYKHNLPAINFRKIERQSEKK